MNKQFIVLFFCIFSAGRFTHLFFAFLLLGIRSEFVCIYFYFCNKTKSQLLTGVRFKSSSGW